MRTKYPQMSEWSLEKLTTSYNQNTSNVWNHNATKDSSSNQRRTKWERSLLCKSLDCCLPASPLSYGLISGVLTGILLLCVILPLWLTPHIRTSILATMTTTKITTTVSTTTITTATSVSTSTTTTTGISVFTSTNETVFGIWNTVAGGNSSPSTVGTSAGNYYPGEEPDNIFDDDSTTKYTNFGSCNLFGMSGSIVCGQDTGFYFTPLRGSSLLESVQFCTANNIPSRDPLTMTIEGSNQPASALTQGSSWSLIYNGSTGLDTNPGRFSYGTTVNISSNSIWYLSYRFLITSKRGVDTAVQYAEVQLTGY